MTIDDLKALAHQFSESVQALNQLILARISAVQALERETQAEVDQLANEARHGYQALLQAVEEHPQLFDSPRTVTAAGVKFGLRKQPGKVIIKDEAKAIERIRSLLPAEQAELLIRRQEAIHKPGVYDLTAGDLKRLGIELQDDEDKPVVTLAGKDDSLKIVSALVQQEPA